jgi:hypothetical protein
MVKHVCVCVCARARACMCACVCSLNLLSASLLCKNIKIETYRAIILYVVLYGCETWSLTLRDQRRLKVFKNRV